MIQSSQSTFFKYQGLINANRASILFKSLQIFMQTKYETKVNSKVEMKRREQERRGFIKRIWRHIGVAQIAKITLGLIMVKFNDESTRDQVLESRVLQFDKKLVIVRPWSTDLNALKMGCDSTIVINKERELNLTETRGDKDTQIKKNAKPQGEQFTNLRFILRKEMDA
ncbi:hypothetical protein F8388_016422 [Cannabis sativa]|uniref:DUF4283 domain-containing protein n=1 Tax=Cannabis sativa TaxID=3483 RepID=A0A7J6GUX3_CANSA|nr:hypothetical protein F8388_016422 [Cannabis sativa]